MNKPRKPVDQLQFKRGGRAERRTFPLAVPDALPPAPPAPRGLTGGGKAMWDAYWSDPVSCAATVADGYDIARFCLLIGRRESEERKLRKEGITVEGYAGPVANPRIRVVRELTREIEKYREQLGILPLARMRLGLVQTKREIGRADLMRRLERHEEATGVIEAEAEVVNLDEMSG